MADPSIDNVVLLANFIGANNDTAYTAEIGGDFSLYADAKLTTSVTQFGNTMAYTDGTGDYMTQGAGGDYTFLHNKLFDWTIEGFFRVADLAATRELFRNTPGTNRGVLCQVWDDGSIYFAIFNGASATGEIYADYGIVSAATTHYLKITHTVADGLVLRLDGVIEGTGTVISPTTNAETSPMVWGDGAEVYFGPWRITKGEALDDSDVPTDVFPDTPTFTGIISVPHPLTAETFVAFNDFSALVSGVNYYYVMEMTGDPITRVPIRSWQSTLQTDRASYLQCVIPAVDDYVTTISERVGTEEFVIYRAAVVNGGEVKQEMARAPITTTALDRGPINYTCTLSGYTDPLEVPLTPKTITLSGLRSSSMSGAGLYRVRCNIDWFIRPGDTVDTGTETFTADYINFYVISDGQEYMDVGDR